VLDELSVMGVNIAIDDFGTGYSSLTYLKRLPVDEIKIDKSFVLGMSHDEDDAAIVRSTVDLGRNLGLRVVAEGIEDADTWTALTTLGCDMAQGYYLSTPVTPAEFDVWMRARLGEGSLSGHRPGSSL
jgi:EAL domain-containing protein (putative c-di-GMP-specific phosphodiesterase class I)